MNLIEINSPLPQVIPNSVIESTLQAGISQLKKLGVVQADLWFEISVALVDKQTIRRYNLEYRKIDQPTDVLSFCYEQTEEKIVGEILLCFEIVQQYAIEDELEVNDELKKNLVHSLLHIIGFEHGDKMFALQAKLLEK